MTQLISIIWIVLLFVVFYLLIVRPQQQRLKKHDELIQRLKVGDEVETIGGIRGKVVSMNTNSLELEIAPKVVITVSQRAVSSRGGEEETAE